MLKITDIKIFVVGNPWKNWIFIRILTDEGIDGLGECTGGLETKSHEAFVTELKSRVIGKNPLNITGLMDFLRKTLFLNSGGCAVSGIEAACWDITGKVCRKPLYQLLGGKAREKIRVYANGWYQGPRTPEGFAEKAKEMVKKGYTALKFDPFGKAYKYMSVEDENLSIRIVEAVRKAVGETVDILIEAHDRFSISQAVRIAGRLEEYRPFWFETPVLSDNFEAVCEVARRVRIPVIAGERTSQPRELAKLLAKGVLDLVNPEYLGCGGIGGLMDCFALARGFDAFVAPHNAQSPYSTAVNVHVGITQPNLIIQECFDDASVEGAGRALSGYPKQKDGFIEPADTPGIGVSFNEEIAAQYPYGDKNFLWMFDDGWERRGGAKSMEASG
ncbi:MAG: mandelate racemase/muconate lactonizing enzyme family protein [Treponema sp.]|jgi:galactonate dehydratase|nr:mandelate racemase/muconate lactonizing enzyme family protein [Treponema sp.]